MKLKIVDGQYNSKSYYIQSMHIADAHYDGIKGTGYILRCHLGSNVRIFTFDSYEACEAKIEELCRNTVQLITNALE
jgi:hypothetical protein